MKRLNADKNLEQELQLITDNKASLTVINESMDITAKKDNNDLNRQSTTKTLKKQITREGKIGVDTDSLNASQPFVQYGELLNSSRSNIKSNQLVTDDFELADRP